MAIHSVFILASEIHGQKEPGGLYSKEVLKESVGLSRTHNNNLSF